eukprot:1254539-Rhodomonas_salina.1
MRRRSRQRVLTAARVASTWTGTHHAAATSLLSSCSLGLSGPSPRVCCRPSSGPGLSSWRKTKGAMERVGVAILASPRPCLSTAQPSSMSASRQG